MNKIVSILSKLTLATFLGFVLLSCDVQETPPEELATKIDSSAQGEAVDLSGSIDIQKVVSPLGIEAWLVEEHSIPIIAINIGFVGGTYLDPQGKEGLLRMYAGLIDEGAGDYDSQAFQSALDENSIGLSFSASRDALTGGLSTLTQNKDLAFDLMRLAVTEPRFDEEPVERIRAQMFVLQKRALSSPGTMASKVLFEDVFGENPYARPTLGTPESVASLTRADFDVFRKTYLTRDRLKVSVVGDITAEELASVLDHIFGNLPAAGDPIDHTPAPVAASGDLIVSPFENPQSTVLFAGPGLLRDDEDFIPAYVVNYILGGGGFSSRLMDEVREKRGLTYGIYTQLVPWERAGLFFGSVASDNAKVAEAIAITKAEIDRIRTEGVTEEELQDAKTYLTGAFALGFDSNGKIASNLLGYQLGGLPLDYINVRNGLIKAVTMEDAERALARLPAADDLTFVVVGEPEGLEADQTLE